MPHTHGSRNHRLIKTIQGTCSHFNSPFFPSPSSSLKMAITSCILTKQRSVGRLGQLTKTDRWDIRQTGRGKRREIFTPTRRDEENSKGTQTNKRLLYCPGSCDACILNGPLQHKQAQLPSTESPEGPLSPERLCVLRRHRYLQRNTWGASITGSN